MEEIASHMGIPKQMMERYAEYPTSHDQHFYYAYEHASPSHGYSSSKHHGNSGHKSNAAMSALTLLAFLFFLHILQQCIKDHMASMSTTPVVIMSAGKDGSEDIEKNSRAKLDKTGVTDNSKIETHKDEMDFGDKEMHLMKIHTPEVGKFKNVYKRGDRGNYFSDMD